MNDITKDPRLPKASRLHVRFLKFWRPGLDRSDWWMSTRGANFYTVWAGPFEITWRRPWLPGPARAHLLTTYGERH